MNQITKTIAQQINARELHMAKFTLVTMDSKNGVLIKKGKKAISIYYDIGSDTYKVEQHKIKGLGTIETEKFDDIYFDQLQEMIQNFFPNFEYVMEGILKCKN